MARPKQYNNRTLLTTCCEAELYEQFKQTAKDEGISIAELLQTLMKQHIEAGEIKTMADSDHAYTGDILDMFPRINEIWTPYLEKYELKQLQRAHKLWYDRKEELASYIHKLSRQTRF